MLLTSVTTAKIFRTHPRPLYTLETGARTVVPQIDIMINITRYIVCNMIVKHEKYKRTHYDTLMYNIVCQLCTLPV